MRNFILVFGLILGVGNMVFASSNYPEDPCLSCENLKNLNLPEIQIRTAQTFISDTIPSPEPWMPTVVIQVPFCKVYGTIGKEINFELLMPHDWNGRFLMSGGGGFVGSIQNTLFEYVNQGFAIVGTDTGHEGGSMEGAWALNNMERQLNFGRMAVHRTAVVSKFILTDFFCKAPDYSYFIGCSRGGGQALVEAQYFPEDFDGIVAGAPAYSWPALGAKFIRHCQSNYPNPSTLEPVITADNLVLLQEHVFKQCDALDGITDRILNDPRDCKFDFSKLPLCSSDTVDPSCFTKAQLAAIQSVYNPLIVNDKMIYPGFPFGLEAEISAWDLWITGTNPFMGGEPSFHYSFGTELFKYLVFSNPDWQYNTYDFENFFEKTQYASSYLDATEADYSGFKKNGGKMILYHGWNDAAISAFSTIQHYEKALEKNGESDDYIRLFLLPGVLHCGGGTGPDMIDWVSQIMAWVEEEKAPDEIVLAKIENGETVMERPVFPYPQLSIYNGTGNSNKVESFKSSIK